mmetsp:Transcript_41541/g.90089  ORF Transcript_41541/g.90089 Transcript_41541/m.90089 type:complete len:227 (+) Transcript_41541:213-893(+)
MTRTAMTMRRRRRKLSSQRLSLKEMQRRKPPNMYGQGSTIAPPMEDLQRSWGTSMRDRRKSSQMYCRARGANCWRPSALSKELCLRTAALNNRCATLRRRSTWRTTTSRTRLPRLPLALQPKLRRLRMMRVVTERMRTPQLPKARKKVARPCLRKEKTRMKRLQTRPTRMRPPRTQRTLPWSLLNLQPKSVLEKQLQVVQQRRSWRSSMLPRWRQVPPRLTMHSSQ